MVWLLLDLGIPILFRYLSRLISFCLVASGMGLNSSAILAYALSRPPCCSMAPQLIMARSDTLGGSHLASFLPCKYFAIKLGAKLCIRSQVKSISVDPYHYILVFRSPSLFGWSTNQFNEHSSCPWLPPNPSLLTSPAVLLCVIFHLFPWSCFIHVSLCAVVSGPTLSRDKFFHFSSTYSTTVVPDVGITQKGVFETAESCASGCMARNIFIIRGWNSVAQWSL